MEKLLNTYYYLINDYLCVSKTELNTQCDYDIECHVKTDLLVTEIIWFIIMFAMWITYRNNTSQIFVNNSTLVYAEQSMTFIQQICRSFQAACNPTIVLFIWIGIVTILAGCYYAAATSRVYKLAFIYYMLLHIISLVGFVKLAIVIIGSVFVIIIPGIVYYLPLWFITRPEKPKNKKVKQNLQKHTDSSVKRANDLIDRIDYLLRNPYR